MINGIKNFFNFENHINIEKKEKNNKEDDFLGLTYSIETVICIEKDTIPILNKYAIDYDKYEKISNQVYSILNNNLTNCIFIEKITIENTGTKSIQFSDFYKNDRLSFENNPKIIAVLIDNKTTKKYINARIDNKKEKIVEIIFDEIEVGDVIEFFVISQKSMKFIELNGKTKDFDKPLNSIFKYQSIFDDLEGDEHDISLSKKIISVGIFFSIFMMLVSIWGLLFINNKVIHIRNPFVVVEVQNVKK